MLEFIEQNLLYWLCGGMWCLQVQNNWPLHPSLVGVWHWPGLRPRGWLGWTLLLWWVLLAFISQVMDAYFLLTLWMVCLFHGLLFFFSLCLFMLSCLCFLQLSWCWRLHPLAFSTSSPSQNSKPSFHWNNPPPSTWTITLSWTAPLRTNMRHATWRMIPEPYLWLLGYFY